MAALIGPRELHDLGGALALLLPCDDSRFALRASDKEVVNRADQHDLADTDVHMSADHFVVRHRGNKLRQSGHKHSPNATIRRFGIAADNGINCKWLTLCLAADSSTAPSTNTNAPDFPLFSQRQGGVSATSPAFFNYSGTQLERTSGRAGRGSERKAGPLVAYEIAPHGERL